MTLVLASLKILATWYVSATQCSVYEMQDTKTPTGYAIFMQITQNKAISTVSINFVLA